MPVNACGSPIACITNGGVNLCSFPTLIVGPPQLILEFAKILTPFISIASAPAARSSLITPKRSVSCTIKLLKSYCSPITILSLGRSLSTIFIPCPCKSVKPANTLAFHIFCCIPCSVCPIKMLLSSKPVIKASFSRTLSSSACFSVSKSCFCSSRLSICKAEVTPPIRISSSSEPNPLTTKKPNRTHVNETSHMLFLYIRAHLLFN